jgi:DNA polymerase-3 subunit gamma/tau
MTFQSTSIKFRPQTFAQVNGQSVTKRILINSILMDRKIKAQCMTGLHGIGKTSLARIYARAVNCSNFVNDVCGECPSCQKDIHPDILEIDAASNNGVDFVRELETFVQTRPTFKKKVLILDEAHMLTTAAQNAFLKILENTSDNICFILVTTNAEALTDTVRSRCLSMPLVPLAPEEITQNLTNICQIEGIDIDKGVVQSLSYLYEGSMREIQQILDQLVLVCENNHIESGDLDKIGLISTKMYKKLAQLICAKNLSAAVDRVRKWHRDGVDLAELFIKGLPNLARDFGYFLAVGNDKDVRFVTGIDFETFQEKLNLNYSDVQLMVQLWEEFVVMMKETGSPKLIWELFFVRWCQVSE